MGWLFAAYAVVWLVFFFYLMSVHRQQKAISEEIADLRNRFPRATD